MPSVLKHSYLLRSRPIFIYTLTNTAMISASETTDAK